jgi:hypothetical protein
MLHSGTPDRCRLPQHLIAGVSLVSMVPRALVTRMIRSNLQTGDLYMMSRMSTLAGGLGFVALAASGLGARAAAAQATPQAAPAPRVRIVEPKQGAIVTGTMVDVVLEAQGVEIAPAAEHRAGTAHHHLFLDTDLTASDMGIPAGMPGIVHLGKGQSTYMFEAVAPGPHRLIALLADPNHVPLKPLVADTVRFTVKP